MDFEILNKPSSIHLINMLPWKKKYLRASHSNFVFKEISKAIMNRSRLRNQFLINRSVESICVALIWKIKRMYYEDLSLSDVNQSKTFRKLPNHCLEIKSSVKVK